MGGGITGIDDGGDSVTSCAKEEEEEEKESVVDSQVGHLSPLLNFLPDVKWRKEREE